MTVRGATLLVLLAVPGTLLGLGSRGSGQLPPGGGDPVERRFELRFEHRAEFRDGALDGRTRPRQPLEGSPQDLRLVRRRVLLDSAFERDGTGAVVAFEREFERLEEQRRHSVPDEDPLTGERAHLPLDVRAESPFQRAKVAFRRASPAEPFGVELLRRGDPERLGELTPDGDLAALGVGPERELGERWTVPASVLGELWQPGGPLAFEDGEGADELDGPARAFLERWWRTLADPEGPLELTLFGRREQLDGRFAELRLAGDVRCRSEWVRVDEIDRGEAGSTEVVFALTGELLWNLGAARPARLSLSAAYRGTDRRDLRQPGPTRPIESFEAVTFSGRMELQVEFRAARPDPPRPGGF